MGAALRRLAETQWQSPEREVCVRVADALDLPMPVQTALLRIAQGAMANVVKHSEATQATISIERDHSDVRLTISDNGRGFDPEGVEAASARGFSDSFGLTATRERVEQLDGTLTVDSQLGAGTTVIVNLTLTPPVEAFALVQSANPRVILMDLQFGALESGAEVTRRIRALDAAPYVLILTNYDTDGDILGAVEAGASGYLLKDAPPHEVIAAVRAAAAGESVLAPVIAGRLLDRMRAPQVSLSKREIEVMELVAQGKSNAAIAGEMFVSQTTVKSHLVHIFSKLNVSSRTAAVSKARELGVLR
ncbi:LuxR C-terminal-related transcriptional regulator [Rhodoglobus aureus]